MCFLIILHEMLSGVCSKLIKIELMASVLLVQYFSLSTMNLYPKESHLWDSAAEGYEFGWGASPGVDVKEEPSKHSSTTLSPALIAIVAVLGSAFLIVSFYKIFAKYCKSCRWSNIIRRLRRVDSREQLDDSDVVLQDSDGWQIFTHAYGLDEVVIKSIPVCTYSRGEKFIDGTECAVCLVEFQENESLRVLPKCSHAFHITCIDLWLRSHANCPLCRANIVNSDSLFVPAMAARIRPSLEHGMALVMHDSFRSEEFNGNARHADQMNNTPQAGPVALGSGLQSRSIVDERTVDVDPFFTKKSPDEAPGAAVADVTERNDMENGLLLSSPSNLARSYSFGSCSGNEIFRSESTREAQRIDLESPMDSLLVTDIASPWRYRRTTFRWSKRFSPFNSKSLFPFNPRGLRSPFFRKGSSSSATYFPSIFPRSPTRRSMADSRHGGATSVRGGSLSPPFFRMARSESVSSLRNQAMTSPLFIKKSFSVFPPSRLRTGDPEALLSPPRFNQHHH